MFTTVEQVKQLIQGSLKKTGRGGFLTGVVTSIAPLTIKADKLIIPQAALYVTDNVIGLRHDCAILRPALKPGDGVLLLCRPDEAAQVQYIVLDRIQPYQDWRKSICEGNSVCAVSNPGGDCSICSRCAHCPPSDCGYCKGEVTPT